MHMSLIYITVSLCTYNSYMMCCEIGNEIIYCTSLVDSLIDVSDYTSGTSCCLRVTAYYYCVGV